jgi:peptidoglycan lytic transglycosylase D
LRASRARAALLAAACVCSWTRAQTTDPLPYPDSLREGVEFWKNVWGTWTMNQVVLHDMEHPSIVYEIFELPGPVGETYTEAQRDYVTGRREAIGARLTDIEEKVAAGLPLEDDEKAVVLKITEVAGSDGLAGAGTRVRSQRGLRERFRRGLEVAGRYHDEFAAIFRTAGLPEDLAYLPHVESSFQVDALSSAGAVGVWQFTRSAARKFMLLTPALDERRDPIAAAHGAARYLQSAYVELESWPMAITSYNHGVGGMRAAKERFGTDFERILREYDGRTFGFASKNFYKEFLAAREIAKDPAAYFPEGLTPWAPEELDRVVLERPTAASRVAHRYGVPLATLASLNPGWTKRALSDRASLPSGTRVWLPQGTLAPVKTQAPIAAVTVAAAAPAATTVAPSAEGGDAVHVVRKGETLFRIATAYGISLTRLLEVNGLKRSATIHPGQEIRIPAMR